MEIRDRISRILCYIINGSEELYTESNWKFYNV